MKVKALKNWWLLSSLFLLLLSSCKKHKEIKSKIEPYVGEYEWVYSVVNYAYVNQYSSSGSIVYSSHKSDTLRLGDLEDKYKVIIKKNGKITLIKNEDTYLRAHIYNVLVSEFKTSIRIDYGPRYSEFRRAIFVNDSMATCGSDKFGPNITSYKGRTNILVDSYFKKK